jgi:hypothetical protein
MDLVCSNVVSRCLNASEDDIVWDVELSCLGEETVGGVAELEGDVANGEAVTPESLLLLPSLPIDFLLSERP